MISRTGLFTRLFCLTFTMKIAWFSDGILCGAQKFPNVISFESATRLTYPETNICQICDIRKPMVGHQRRNNLVLNDKRFPDSNESQIIDLMIVYESSVKNLAGGTKNLKELIAKAIEDTNKCFSNSLIPLQVRLVHSMEVFYELVDFNVDFNRLSSSDDGYLDYVYYFRKLYGADLVSMLSSVEDSWTGMGDIFCNCWANTASDEMNEFGFNINLWSDLGAPQYTLAHEIGHALGCWHNREAVVGSTEMLFPYAYGKRWFSGDQGIRTIMAYDDNVYNYPTTIPYFSNPDVSYLSNKTGNINSEDNAQVIRRTSSFISSLRSTKVQGIHPSQFDLALESGIPNKIGVKLMMSPSGTKEVSVAIKGTTKVVLSKSTKMTFDSSNWNVPQFIELMASNVDKNHTAQLTFSSSGLEDQTLPAKVGTSMGLNPLGWMWLENYPWVFAYDNQDWLYFLSSEGKWMYFENSVGSWSEINIQSRPIGWLWFNHYPWVFSNTKKDWLYFQLSGGKLMYYSNRFKVWHEFNRNK